MRHIPNNSQMHVPVVHTRHDERAATADDCVACDVRAAYNMLTRSMGSFERSRWGNGTIAALPANAATPAYP